MKYLVVGSKKVQYTKKTGEYVDAVELHLVSEIRGEEGQTVEKKFIHRDKLPSELIPHLNNLIGGELDVEYDSRGYATRYGFVPRSGLNKSA